ncbi:hypothetical protein OG705_29690 [Streptomyces sp. NBC_00838]|uniref:hypothetical protein n=1 Tax=Streptomyces sp. NBC_00838 TaxID=2903680 RepID=UPI0038630A0E|nr:hypothetical protein OG705_29690 [Streptomyces sp. NBC_00838]
MITHQTQRREAERSTAHYLRALRRSYLSSAVQSAGGDLKVALYVLIETGQDPQARLTAAHALAAMSGWTVVTRTFDTTGPTDPTTRPQLARLLSEVQRGEVHVVVAASRIDISMFDDRYQVVLGQLKDGGGGLALAWDETSL